MYSKIKYAPRDPWYCWQSNLFLFPDLKALLDVAIIFLLLQSDQLHIVLVATLLMLQQLIFSGIAFLTAINFAVIPIF